MNKEKFIQSLKFKYYILTFDTIDMKTKYDNLFHKPFEEFVKRYEITKEIDPAFFYGFSGLSTKIRNTIFLYEHENKKSSDFDSNKAKKIISDMDMIDSLSEEDKIDMCECHRTIEEEDRIAVIDDPNRMKEIIASDIIIYSDIKNGIERGCYSLLKKDGILYKELFHMSYYKFLTCCPELFDDDEFANNAINLFNKYCLKDKKDKTDDHVYYYH